MLKLFDETWSSPNHVLTHSARAKGSPNQVLTHAARAKGSG